LFLLCHVCVWAAPSSLDVPFSFALIDPVAGFMFFVIPGPVFSKKVAKADGLSTSTIP